MAEFGQTDLGKEGVLLNLASNEYAGVTVKQFKNRVITIHLKNSKTTLIRLLVFSQKARMWQDTN